MNFLCQETFRTAKLVRLILESLSAFAESPETLPTSQKSIRNSKILKDITKNRSVMIKGEKSLSPADGNSPVGNYLECDS